MVLLIASLLVLVAAFFSTRWASGWVRRAEERWRAYDAGLMTAAGFKALSDEPFSFDLEGAANGVAVRAKRQHVRLPGQESGESSGASVVTLSLPDAGADLVACKSADSDQVFGPLPTAPRVPTGHARFDAHFDVRGAALDVSPELLDAMMALDLHFLRRRADRLEVHVKAREPRFAALWMDVLRALAERGDSNGYRQGRTPSFRAPAEATERNLPNPVFPLWIAWMACAATVPMLAMVMLGAVPALRGLFAGVSGCRDNGPMTAGSINDSFTMFCADGSEASLLVIVAAGAVAAALTMLVGMAYASRVVWASRAQAAPPA